MTNTAIGIFAHVDAGKTTLSEALLYLSGAIRSPGRVDHQNTFLDTEALEKARGITIFSKQAVFKLPGGRPVTLLDTPGHVDFGAEAERVLQVLDYAIMVISGADGVQGHTLTMWHLLEKYRIPTFLFVNKMDQPGTDRQAILRELTEKLSSHTVAFDDPRNDTFWENLAVCDDALTEKYLEGQMPDERDILRLIASGRVVPCYFGSALKMTGVSNFLEDLDRYALPPSYPSEFGARVFKITRDKLDTRLTHMKITGGVLHTKDTLGEQLEKVNQIRIYSGEKYESLREVDAGTVCAVAGPVLLLGGDGLGIEKERQTYLPVLEPVLEYQLILPPELDPHQAMGKLLPLEEETPQLHIAWAKEIGEIHLRLMGEVEKEILQERIRERLEREVDFGPGRIIYKETILEPVEGVGHYEPLRHYAEVHLLLTPGERGSGLTWANGCPPDTLEEHYQKMILSQLQETRHVGALTGSEITDIQITLTAGRSHLKHTQGGDFYQAACRALRHGLRKAKSRLMEPIYTFRLEIPAANLGRALSDLSQMEASKVQSNITGETAVLTGYAPVRTMGHYSLEVAAYSRGFGRLACVLEGYALCADEEEVIEAIGYDPDQDIEHPAGSIFCGHGAGYFVPWDQVEAHMHLPLTYMLDTIGSSSSSAKLPLSPKPSGVSRSSKRDAYGEEAELMAIFEKTYGPIKRDRNPTGRHIYAAGQDQSATHGKTAGQDQSATHGQAVGQNKPSSSSHSAGQIASDAYDSVGSQTQPSARSQQRGNKGSPNKEKYLLVDGYNIIFDWQDLSELAKVNMDAARMKLMDRLCNYQGFRQETVIVVFDAYRVEGGTGSSQKYGGIYVIYTKEAETADQYIEKVVHQIGRKYDVTVATSDAAEQMIIWGDGARRLSAKGLLEEMGRMEEEIRTHYPKPAPGQRNYLIEEAMKKQLSDN
jgi:small GTP-binding protein